ncbi:MAG TPA: YggS family pyridoxal phosphate-dependent enzyme [bacterium]|nr:YggS family pyridoxal phosphate-dependent enzyme [bacterium]
MEQPIVRKIADLKQSIEGIAKKASRPYDAIRFILVTKGVAIEKIAEARDAGIQDFGENRIQEFLRKQETLPGDIHWHFIGRLQTNKVKFLLKKIRSVSLLHSLDREELAREIEREAARMNIAEVPCLIQINGSQEKTKGGFMLGQAADFVARLPSRSRISIRGLMTIGPLTEDRQKIRAAFRCVREERERLAKRFPEKDWGILSMGMSSDYEIAIEEGANLLRIGTAVFGPRQVIHD